MELTENLEKQRRFLVDRLDPDHGFLDEFKVSNAKIIEIRCIQNTIMKNQKILDYVLDKNICTVFIQALNNSKQEHIANFILANGEYKDEYEGNWPLTHREIKPLVANHKELVDRMDTESGLLDQLYSKNVVNIRKRESINATQIRHRKVEVLLEMLRRCSLNDYRLTIECLQESNQNHVAELLQQGEREEAAESILKQIDTDLEKVAECSAAGVCRKEKLTDGKEKLLKTVENAKDAIIKKTAELQELLNTHMKSLLDVLSGKTEEKLKELENEEQQNNEMLMSLESLESYCNELKSKESSVSFFQSAENAHIRADELEKFKSALLQRQIPSATASFAPSTVEEFARITNIIGQIEIRSDATPIKEKKVIVVGTNDGEKLTNEVFEFDIHRPNEMSYLQPVPSQMRWSMVAVTYEGNLFVIGIGDDYDEIWKFEKITSWTKCEYLSNERLSFCATVVGNSLYILGGRSSYLHTGKVLRSVEKYDFIKNTCSITGELKLAVECSASVAYNYSIYIFGGISVGNVITDCIQKYNAPHNECYLFKMSLPFPQSSLKALTWNNYVILLNCSTCLIFDFENMIWRKRKRFRNDFKSCGYVIDDEKLYVFGGENRVRGDDGKSVMTYRDNIKSVSLEDIVNDNSVEWKQHDPLPMPSSIVTYA